MHTELSPEHRMLLTGEEVARKLAVSRSTVWRLGQSGTLRRVRIGGSIRYLARDVEAMIERATRSGDRA
jgi:excisionase family DNA binding protein